MYQWFNFSLNNFREFFYFIFFLKEKFYKGFLVNEQGLFILELWNILTIFLKWSSMIQHHKTKRWEKENNYLIDPFHATGLFLYPLKTLKIFWCTDVFRGYRKRPVERNYDVFRTWLFFRITKNRGLFSTHLWWSFRRE